VSEPAHAKGRITVLVADDEHLVRSGLRLMLGTQPDIDIVAEAIDGTRAVEAVERLRPNVALMDIRMPGMDGLQATGLITAANRALPEAERTRVIILTTFEHDDYVFEALRSGASGFLLKRTKPEELIDAIRIVVRGDSLLSPSVTTRLIAHFIDQPPPLSSQSSEQLGRLTEREREVLVEIARGRCNSEIAGRLYVGEQTIKTHIKHIFTKLDFRDRAQAVVFAYEQGLVRAGDVNE
jgi:DNA-binding NarL/FixJ family response regulator